MIKESKSASGVLVQACEFEHGQRSAMFSIKMIAEFLDKTLPKMLAVYENVDTVNILPALRLKDRELDFIRQNPAIDLNECIGNMKKLLDSYMQNLKQNLEEDD